jgi:hypothetical protein
MQSFDVVVLSTKCGDSCCSRAKAKHSSSLRFAVFCDMVEIGFRECSIIYAASEVVVSVFGELRSRW